MSRGRMAAWKVLLLVALPIVAFELMILWAFGGFGGR